jgi:CheY-like chemotaxis protein
LDVVAVPLEGIRVLAVDDDPDTLDFLCFVLEREGALVTCVNRSEDALARLKAATEADRPHVLISDLAMPKKDGVWLLKAVRALPPDQGGAVPALALTAFTSQATADQLAEVGFQMRLTKPMDPATLIEAVRTLAGRGVAEPRMTS